LQLAVITTFEITQNQALDDEVDLFELTSRFCKPVDGLPLQIIDQLTPTLRANNKGFLTGWFELTRSIKNPISTQLIEWVVFRNKRPGHGVLDESTTKTWSQKTEQLIKDCLIVFDAIIPIIDQDGNAKISKDFSNLKIKTPVTYQNHAFVIIDVLPKKGVWKLKGQMLSNENATEFTINLSDGNIFSNRGIRPTGKYDLTDFVYKNTDCSLFHNIPVRQTDTFEGRSTEINKLTEWLDDEERCCLVFGDGGYGKTTLVLEFLNSLMESQLNFSKKPPEVICYYTAKKTRWSENGLIHFASINPAMDECVRELMRCFEPVLPKEWYTIDGKRIIDKAIGVLKSNGYSRDDILLVIDNTETLAISSDEVKELGDFFTKVGKLVGRLIITSRRREFIAATPIQVEGLLEEESVSLMRRLAKEYNAKPINQAGESTLRKVANQLMRKPILLEALVKYISYSNLGIDYAIFNIFKKSNEDLLDFLYEDAWQRMNELQQQIFLVIIHISSPLDQNSIGQTCQEVGVQHSEFQKALQETHFAVLTDYGRSYSLELVDLARRFFLQQFARIPESEKYKLKIIALNVDEYAKQREQIEREYKTDRVAEAFRSDYAKAAKVYVDKGDIGHAIEMYELAIEDDPINSALHDRFSWLLLNRTQNFEYAKKISKKAVELDNNNCDAVVGLALVYYRLGDLIKGDEYIDKTHDLGRSYSFCYLRKSIARYHKARNVSDLDEAIKMLEDAQELLISAEKSNKKSCGYDIKNANEILKYQDLTKSQLTILRSRRTKISHLTN
jgi:tetratricopeptide (TPR) repeat protein/GTPase SAR1 family protein